MRAIVWTGYGPPDVLQLQEVSTPTPAADEVLIRIHATTVVAGDCEMRQLDLAVPFRYLMRLYAGLRSPTRVTILGMALAGEIEAVGGDVTRFEPGDRVFGPTGFHFGGYAEYASLPADHALATIPASMSDEEVASVPVGGLEALHFLRRADVQDGERVLINGAGGSIGTFAVQLANRRGATVTAVDSAAKLDTLRSIGADSVIDYADTDFTTTGSTYDVIFDVVGTSPYSRCLDTLAENGRYLLGNPSFSEMIRGRLRPTWGTKRVVSGPAGHTTEDLAYLADLIETGAIEVVLDRSYPLAEMTEAHRYVESGAKQGNIAISVDHETRELTTR